MTTAQFIAKYNGKPIDFDGRYGNQCMDEAAQFVAEVWGKSGWDIAKGFAYQVWTEFNTLPVSKYAHLVANTPSGIPPEGALVVWSTGLGQAGHIAVARAGSTTSVLKTFDQNWNYHQYCEPVDHNYNYVYGWKALSIQEKNALINLKNSEVAQQNADTRISEFNETARNNYKSNPLS